MSTPAAVMNFDWAPLLGQGGTIVVLSIVLWAFWNDVKAQREIDRANRKAEIEAEAKDKAEQHSVFEKTIDKLTASFERSIEAQGRVFESSLKTIVDNDSKRESLAEERFKLLLTEVLASKGSRNELH